MLKKIILVTLIIFSSFIYSQISFETGYYINNNGEKINGLIKNYEWKNNPSAIEYKLSNDHAIKKIDQTEFSEFGVGNLKFVRATVMIDKASSNINNLSSTKDFIKNEETILLKSVVDGEMSLYKYVGNGAVHFFYKKRDSELFQQLFYKEYLVQERYIQKNEEYKKQLAQEFSSSQKFNINEINKLSYKEAELIKIFSFYNGPVSRITNENTKTKNFYIYIKPGIGFSKYSVLPPSDNTAIAEIKNSTIMYRIALELEYVLNFNKGKWAVFSEPSFQTMNHKIENYNRRNFEVKYTSLQIPLGVKHNMFIDSHSKIYISGALYSDIPLNSHFLMDDTITKKISNKLYYTFAIGYNYNKFGAEFKYGVTPYFSSSYYGQQSSYGMDGLNVSLSYKLF